MRRTVIGIVLAAALLLPELGLAASRQSAKPTPPSLWEIVVEWAGRLVGRHAGNTMKDTLTPPAHPISGDGGNEVPQSGTTIDPYG